MKTVLNILTAALLFGMVTSSAQARDAVSVDFFYDNLEPHGNWREVGGYGYCWQPRDVGPDWRPYSDGRWVYTDAGWTWDSNEDFGWAVYHYGRWVDVGHVGWVWVPGTEWGPGWVSWRHSAQHTGWAPLPPEARLLFAIGLSSWVDDYYDIGPSHYRFVENRNFGSRRLNTVFVDQRQNISIINQTTNITNISYVNNVVYNGGPVYDQQIRQSNEPIQRYRLDRREDYDGSSRRQSPEYLRSRIDGDSMSVLALPFTGKSASAPRQLGERVERAEINHGWRNAGTPDEIATMREKMKSKERAPDRLPPPNAFVKVTDEAAVREERPTMPAERPSKSKGKGADRPSRPEMPPTVPEGQTRPVDRPPTDAPKGKGADKPGRPDMPPSATEKPFRPEGRPPTSTPKFEKPVRPDMPTSADKPNRGGRNKVEAPQLPRSENRPPTTVMPKERVRPNVPQIAPPESRPMPGKPGVNEPKESPIRPAPRPPQVTKPATPTPPAAVPPKPERERGKGRPGDRKKKDD